MNTTEKTSHKDAVEIAVMERNGTKNFEFAYEDRTLVLANLSAFDFDARTIRGTVTKRDGRQETFIIRSPGGMGSYPSIDLSNLFKAQSNPASSDLSLSPDDFEIGDKITLNAIGDDFVPTWVAALKRHSALIIA